VEIASGGVTTLVSASALISRGSRGGIRLSASRKNPRLIDPANAGRITQGSRLWASKQGSKTMAAWPQRWERAGKPCLGWASRARIGFRLF